MRHPSDFDYREILTEEEIAEARTKTCDQILEEGIHMLIEIAYENGLSDKDVDNVLINVGNTRAGRVRGKFRIL